MIRRPPRSTQSRSSAASDVYKRQDTDAVHVQAQDHGFSLDSFHPEVEGTRSADGRVAVEMYVRHPCLDALPENVTQFLLLSLIHISEPTRRTPISYAVFCLKKKK